MKKIVSLMGIIALCAASFTACNKVSENDIQEKGKHFVKFTPVLGETRTILEENGNTISVKWAASDVDKFHVWENDAKGLTEATLNSDNTIATITGVFENESAGSYVYTSCFAADVDANGNPVVPAIQDALAGSFDPNADILIGEDITETTPQEELLVNFTRPVALTKMTLKGLEVGESVVSVSITAKNGTLTGVYDRTQGVFNLTNGEATIVVCPTGVTVGSDGTAPVYFVSAPVENEILEVEVWTSIGGGEPTAERHYKKEFAKGISFPANKLTRFTANVTCCEEVEGDPQEETIFKETFDQTGGTGGNDNKWNGNIATNSIIEDNAGWFYANPGGGNKCIKLGTGSKKGSANTPALGITASTATITFKAAAWDQENATISLEAPEGVTISSISPNATLKNGEWGTYTATITGANEETEIVFKASQNRFFLDEVEVKEVRVNDPNIVHLEVADNTEINGSQTEATVDIRSNKAWTVTSSDELLADTPIKINGTAQTTSFTVNFAASNTSVTEPKVATLHVVAGAGSYAEEKDITITQKPVTAYINIPTNEKTQTVEASATSATFTVSGCNFDWDVVSVTVNGEANPNYTATKGANDVVTVSFPSNVAPVGETTLDKVIVVSVGAEGIKTNTCTITQKGSTSLDPNKKYFVEVTAAPAGNDWSGIYLLVSGTNAYNGAAATGSGNEGISVNVAGTLIEANETAKLNSVIISNGTTSGAWYIHGKSGYIGASGSSGGFLVGNDGIDNTISYNGSLKITSGDYTLRYNSGHFRYYSSASTGNAVKLFKFTGTESDLFIGQLTMSNVSCTNNGQSESSLTFGWNSVEGAIGYQVSEDGESYGQIQNARTYTISNLEPETTKTIWVKAIGDGTFYTTSSAKSAAGTTKGEGGGGDGDTETSTLTFTSACGGSGTADDGVSWTVTSDGTESSFDSNKGIHYGTSSAQVQYVSLSTSGISGTITKVVVNASTANGVSATVDVKVGGSTFGGNPQSLSSSAAYYTFEGSASGAIVVTVTKPEKASKALYVKSVAVTYTK